VAAETLDLQTVELESVLRPTGLNGAPGSADYNASAAETLMDLTTITEILNTQILPLLNALRAGAALPTASPIGIQGSTVLTDTTDLTSLCYDASTSLPLCIADSLRVLNGQNASIQTLVNNLSVQVQSLSTSLSTTGQNDIASAVSNMYVLIATIQAQISALQGATGGTTASLGNLQSQLVSTSPIYPGAIDSIPVIWASAFPDNTYSVSYALNDDTGNLVIDSYSYLPTGTGISVRVRNTSTTATVEGIISVTARQTGGTIIATTGTAPATSITLIDTATGQPVVISITNGELDY
jgi:hypothetical protein